MAPITTGRTLDASGKPIDGTGFTYEPGDALDVLLQQRISPLFSEPITGEWVAGLVLSGQTRGEYERGIGIFTPGNAGPPEHFHPLYDEHFEIVRGEFVFLLGGEERTAKAGDQFAVAKGTPHTFRCVGDTVGVVVVETRPAARIGEVISTLFGMAHEGKLTRSGQPKLMHAMVIGSAYDNDTVFTSPPPAITRPLAKMLAPLGRMMGYRATDPRYADPAWWDAHVEQPQASQA
jgi:quercetin dioxygenase-like cupin family protein